MNDVYKIRGFNIGKSLVSDGSTDISDIVSNPKLVVADDVIVHDANDVSKISVKKIVDVSDDDVIADAGPSLIEMYNCSRRDHVIHTRFSYITPAYICRISSYV